MSRRTDLGPRASLGHRGTQGVAVIGAAGEQDAPGLDGVEHIGGRVPAVSLALGQLEAKRPALGIGKRMDLGGQAAARASHATGSLVFFWLLAAC